MDLNFLWMKKILNSKMQEDKIAEKTYITSSVNIDCFDGDQKGITRNNKINCSKKEIDSESIEINECHENKKRRRLKLHAKGNSLLFQDEGSKKQKTENNYQDNYHKDLFFTESQVNRALSLSPFQSTTSSFLSGEHPEVKQNVGRIISCQSLPSLLSSAKSAMKLDEETFSSSLLNNQSNYKSICTTTFDEGNSLKGHQNNSDGGSVKSADAYATGRWKKIEHFKFLAALDTFYYISKDIDHHPQIKESFSELTMKGVENNNSSTIFSPSIYDNVDSKRGEYEASTFRWIIY